ncbi:MAG: UDP-4-amino-4,6-dideoxy-N-acetyl-beta-L-altrosamine transaminase [Elusimicrobia bacterium]|nr:UDP-4-amino-4,6-dideoxy-N-acetyl-beta-L-altrosamine transaminase [Elusimicrobiota bacterium]MDE2511430.1 UDP-4-amino-4,6-dideoxy-N-acetyl-beta-L-altrosamine transaminase [Elusimicrobiota bacterium]
MKPLSYGRQVIDAADRAAVDKALRSPWLTQGPAVTAFEEALAKACGAKYAVACTNGTAALHLACLAAGLAPGDEAVVPAITFAATANAAVYCGAKPVIVDVNPDTITLDPDAFAKALSPRTKAVLPVHFAGLPAEMETIRALARKRKMIVIEDAAHALGASYKGKRIGACDRSDMAILSFHPVKHVATGEGGAVLTNRPDLRDRLRLFRSHGITRDPALLEKKNEGGWYYEMQALGFNYRITDLQCALGLSQLKKLPRFLKRRREIARAYQKAFSGDPRIRLQALPKDREHAYHLFTIQVPASRRRALYDYLHARGILANVHYIPVHKLPFYQRRGWAGKRLPNAEGYYAGALSLPMHAALTDADVRRVIRTVFQGLDARA